jgi:hypothetical protein
MRVVRPRTTAGSDGQVAAPIAERVGLGSTHEAGLLFISYFKIFSKSSSIDPLALGFAARRVGFLKTSQIIRMHNTSIWAVGAREGAQTSSPARLPRQSFLEFC